VRHGSAARAGAWSVVLAPLWPAAAASSLAGAVWYGNLSARGLGALVAGTIAAYAVDRLLDDHGRLSCGTRRGLLLMALGPALAGTMLAWTPAPRLAGWLGIGLLALAYTQLKRRVPKTLLVTGAWTGAIAVFPAAVPPTAAAMPWPALAAVALIMAANALLSDVADSADDRASGVLGLAAARGPRAAAVAAVLCALAGTAEASRAGLVPLAVTAASLLLPAAWALRDPRRRDPRRVADALVTLLPGPLAWLLAPAVGFL
jgi:4-hydroxybenzoate polyprenyltransferase